MVGQRGRLVGGLYTGYTAAAERMTGDRQRTLADFLDDLLDGRQASAAAVSDRSRALGVALPSPPALLVVEAAAPMSTVTLLALEDLFRSLASDLSRGHRGAHRAHRPTGSPRRHPNAPPRHGPSTLPAMTAAQCKPHGGIFLGVVTQPIRMAQAGRQHRFALVHYSSVTKIA